MSLTNGGSSRKYNSHGFEVEKVLIPARLATIVLLTFGIWLYADLRNVVTWALILFSAGYNLFLALGGDWDCVRCLGRANPYLHCALCVAGLLLTGGLESPFHPLLTVNLCAVAMRCRRLEAVLISLGSSVTLVAGCVILHGKSDPVRSAMFITLNLLAVWMVAGLAQLAREQRARFLRTASHELHNPMTAIKGVASLLRRKSEDLSGADSIRLLNILDKEVDHLASLLTALTEASVALDGRYPYRPVRSDLEQIVRAATEVAAASDPSHVYVSSSVASEPMWVSGDPKRLEGVFKNILGNAAKYSPADSEISVSIERTDDQAKVAVSDRGVGIPADQVDKVFEAFFRADNIARSDPGGMGLGLFICKEIVEQHGGHIHIQSEEGFGTTVSLDLPLVASES